MRLLQTASARAVQRGYEYYRQKRVHTIIATGDAHYTGTVRGSGNHNYLVTLDLHHPKKSTCTCPHAKDRPLICKHMVALYFALFPDEAERYIEAQKAALAAAEARLAARETQLLRHLQQRKKDELIHLLLTLLQEGPDWQYDRFIREHLDIK